MHNSMRNKIPQLVLKAVVQKLDPSLKFVFFYIGTENKMRNSHLSDTIVHTAQNYFTCLLIVGHFSLELYSSFHTK